MIGRILEGTVRILLLDFAGLRIKLLYQRITAITAGLAGIILYAGQSQFKISTCTRCSIYHGSSPFITFDPARFNTLGNANSMLLCRGVPRSAVGIAPPVICPSPLVSAG